MYKFIINSEFRQKYAWWWFPQDQLMIVKFLTAHCGKFLHFTIVHDSVKVEESTFFMMDGSSSQDTVYILGQ